MKITSVEKPLPQPAAPVWSGKAVDGSKNLEWFYWPRHWLHVREQDRRNPLCWMNIEPPQGTREAVQRAIRKTNLYA